MTLLIIVGMMLAVPCCYAGEMSFTPWDFKHKDRVAEKSRLKDEEAKSIGGTLLIKMVRFYQYYISPVIGDRCPMYPSCSAYSIEALKKHGFFLGWIMTADRLIHENNEMDGVPMVKIKDEYRYYDPVQNNDFWWYKPKDLNLKKID